jgi:hypothetical protein
MHRSVPLRHWAEVECELEAARYAAESLAEILPVGEEYRLKSLAIIERVARAQQALLSLAEDYSGVMQ